MGTQCPKCKYENPSDTLFCGRCAARLDGAGTGSGTGPSFTRTMETPKTELGRGTVFAGRFEIIEELGAGGMGKVFRAYDKEVGEEVALKLLHPEIALSKRTVDRFRNEIKLARKITHRNVCRMHELHQDGSTLFITMEYVTGQDLKGLIRQTGALTTGKTISIARQVAEGLAEAHHLGVVHRDLKPQNIMVDKEGNAKVMDFGIARSLAGAGMTAEGTLIGTPEYMSPEQVEGKEADQRSDLYALGVILFEMATGRVPFEGDTPLSVAYKHRNEIPIAPRKLNSQVPEPLNKVILRCLEKDKADRYQTAEELLADLTLVEEGLPITERAVTKTRTTLQRSALRPRGARRYLVPALAALGVIVSAFVFSLILPRGKSAMTPPPSGKPGVAILPFDNLSGDPSLDVYKDGLAEMINFGLADSKLIIPVERSALYGTLKKLRLEGTAKYTREDLVRVARENGVEYTTTGSMMKAGQSFIFLLNVQRPRAGELVEPIKLTCSDEGEIVQKADEMVTRIKAAMGLSSAQLTQDAGRGIAEITTRSPEARKYFLESFGPYNRGEYDKVKILCERAVELDPDFALAYVSLAVAYESGEGNYSKGRELRAKALALSDRLPERERYKVVGNYYQAMPGEDMRAKAIEAYEKYIEYAPRDAGELGSLGSMYASSGDFQKGLEYHKRAYEVDPSPPYLIGIVLASLQMGQLDQAAAVLTDYYKQYQDAPMIQAYSPGLYMNRGEFDKALAEIERGFLQNPSPPWSWDVMKGDVSMARGDLVGAEKIYLRVIEKPEKPGYVLEAKESLIRLYILQGKLKLAASPDLADALIVRAGGGLASMLKAHRIIQMKDYEKAWESIERGLTGTRKLGDPPLMRKWLWWKGMAALARHDVESAGKIEEEIRASALKSPYKNAMKETDHLRGLIDLEKGNNADAIENIKKACAWLSSEVFGDFAALHIYPLALAYFRSGDLSKARKEFERVATSMRARFEYGDLYSKSFYWLGKIAEAQKDKRRAVENYGKFLELWKDADPGQLEMDDAKVRLAALK